MELIVQPDGTVRSLYDELIDLSVLGKSTPLRASYVEPDKSGRWFAGLSPQSGPRLGPFVRRSEALAAEHQWLIANWLLTDR